jgi:glycerol-3-phosphate dehydrogenase (NAD(P)+)
MTRAAVMGSGSWGTAFGLVMADAGTEVVLWGIDAETVAAVNRDHENPRYHPGIPLPPLMSATTDAAAALRGADIVVLAIPSQVLRENLAHWVTMIEPHALLVSLMKGIELGTTKRMSEVIEEVAGVSRDRIVVVSGPNLAREIAQRQPAATLIACADERSAEAVQRACLSPYFRPYTGTDVVGAELGGSVKNVIALANGMAAGLGFGENAQATLITRGLAEMMRLGIAMGADPATAAGLAGVGDLVATCTSPLSRNRTFGENLGKGMTVAEVVAITQQTCEGVKSCQSIYDLAVHHGVEMPITEQVVQVVHHGLSPRDILGALMARPWKSERA